MGRDIPSRIKAKFLPNLVVVEPIGDWTDGHIRLAGSLLMERFGREIQGMLISELYAIYPAMGDMLVESARRSEKTRKPGILSARICAGSVELMRFEAVGLPVFAPDGIAQWNLVGVFRF